MKQYHMTYDGIGVQAHPSTLDWLQDRFRVSTLFLDCITDTNYAASWKTGNASFLKHNKRGKVTVIGPYSLSLFAQQAILISIRWNLPVL